MVPTRREKFHEYLSQKTFKQSLLLFRFAAWTKCVPFQLSATKDLTVHKFIKAWKLAGWHVTNWIFTFAFVFQCVSFVCEMANNSSIEQLTIHLLYVANCTFGFIYMISMYLKPNEAIVMLNQQVFLLKSLPDIGLPKYEWWKEPFVIVTINYLIVVFSAICIVLTTFFVSDPRRSCYLYAYLPAYLKQSNIVFSMMLFYEFTYMLWAVTIVITYYVYWISALFMLNHIFKFMMCRDSVTEMDLKGFMYVQLFCKIFNDFNASFFVVGFNFVVVAYPVALFFIILKYFNDLGLLLQLLIPSAAIFCVFLIVAFLPQDAKVKVRSTNYLEAIRTRKIGNPGIDIACMKMFGMPIANEKLRTKFVRRRIRSLLPVGIQIGSFGDISFGTSECMLEQLFNNVLLLLSL